MFAPASGMPAMNEAFFTDFIPTAHIVSLARDRNASVLAVTPLGHNDASSYEELDRVHKLPVGS